MGWSFQDLQEEQKPWVAHNFGDRPAWMPLLGVVEELGEFYTAVDEKAYDSDEVRDALGDICIYLSDFCSALSFDLQMLTITADFDNQLHRPLKALSVHTGLLAHAYLKQAQGIRGDPMKHARDMQEAIVGIMRHVLSFAENRRWKLVDVVHEVWDRVKQRDWKANAQTGQAAETGCAVMDSNGTSGLSANE